ncbi:DUF4251 domain-containing protein [Muriicola sp. Z0-33]|uniref:DUF4251 domain-containing protein n=1 Tax=Muriicola sp. Z0-33 TaxID=2816957 RepID=UPI0022375F3A|nr:DUF4251 domain-containing protein [Muriicola sp. Z0-33]MCW5515257.1 DUF4251 domain-containing protein [Muriicola sp. Z0-33]
MKISSSLLLLFILMCMGCGSSNKIVEPSAQSRQLDQWVAQKSFEINSDWAIPLMTNSLNQVTNAGIMPPGSSANRISIIGTSNHLRMSVGELDASLPFFGERQVGGGYNNAGSGIILQGTPRNYEAVKDERTLKHTIKFDVRNKTEAFDVTLTLYPNLTSEIQINSSQRFPMRYTGRVKAIAAE